MATKIITPGTVVRVPSDYVPERRPRNGVVVAADKVSAAVKLSDGNMTTVLHEDLTVLDDSTAAPFLSSISGSTQVPQDVRLAGKSVGG